MITISYRPKHNADAGLGVHGNLMITRVLQSSCVPSPLRIFIRSGSHGNPMAIGSYGPKHTRSGGHGNPMTTGSLWWLGRHEVREP